MIKRYLGAGALALSVGLTATDAFAQATTIPGEQVGLAVGAPLPEGVYAIDTFLYRSPDSSAIDVSGNVPVLVWATPFLPLGGRVELIVAAPTIFAFGRNGGPSGVRDTTINVGTLLGGIWAFDLGNNFGVSFLGAVHLNELDGDRGVLVTNSGAVVNRAVLPQLASNTYRLGVAASYTGYDWNLTANVTYNFYDTPARFGSAGGTTLGPINLSDALNVDLTATKKFDIFNEGKAKFEIGAIGYGTVNLEPNTITIPTISSARVGRGGFIAVGGLVGYDFGRFTAQAYVARYVAESAGVQPATEGWFRVIVPLYSPPAPAPEPAPIVRKY